MDIGSMQLLEVSLTIWSGLRVDACASVSVWQPIVLYICQALSSDANYPFVYLLSGAV